MTREMETWLSDSRVGDSVVWLSTEADDQSSLHCVTVSTDVMSDQLRIKDDLCYRRY